MCGIAGVLSQRGIPPTVEDARRMVSIIGHRGPDAAGLYIDDQVSLAHARLSIVDIAGGLQPLRNEDDSIWLIANGEIYNSPQLQRELEARGHVFRTNSDCEVILH